MNGFWAYVNERHRIWLRRQTGKPKPWTADPILLDWRFCNVYRELDTVTMWIRKNWREPYADHPNLWFAMGVARQINWPPTLDAIGFPAEDIPGWSARAINLMHDMQARKEKVYTGAYMLRGDIQGGLRDKPTYTMEKVLRPLWEAAPWRESFSWLRRAWGSMLPLHGWGGFLAYEVVTDLRHTRYLEGARDIHTWAFAGPGAVRGLNRLLLRPLNAPMATANALRIMRTLHDEQELYRAREIPPLEMRDIEHSLCEFDKYERIRRGEGRPRARYQGRA